VAFHGTGFLGDAPLGPPPPGLEADLIRLTTSAVTHELSVANVGAILATVERLYAMATDDQPGAAEFLDRMAWLRALVDEIAADGARLDA
jgi:hypothetical protein